MTAYNSTSFSDFIPLDRLEGALLAAAVGDALGWPNEIPSKRADKAKEDTKIEYGFRRWMRRAGGRYWDHLEAINPGEYSDDTQLMLATARSLLSGGGWFSQFTRQELPAWLLYERGGGKSTRAAARKWGKGIPAWEDKDSADLLKYFASGGNGVAMRVLPHALLQEQSPTLLREQIFLNGISTHGHPRAILGALLYGYAAQFLGRFNGTLPYGGLIECLLDTSSEWGILPEVTPVQWLSIAQNGTSYPYREEWVKTVGELLDGLQIVKNGIKQGALSVDLTVLSDLGGLDPKINGAGTVTSLASIYFASRYASDPITGILEAAYFTGMDTDTVASMTGGLLGALNGTNWMLPDWDGVQDYDYILHIAHSLSQVKSPDFSESTSPSELWSEKQSDKVILDLEKGANSLFISCLGTLNLITVVKHPSGSKKLSAQSFKLQSEQGQTIFIKKLNRIPGTEEVIPEMAVQSSARPEQKSQEIVTKMPDQYEVIDRAKDKRLVLNLLPMTLSQRQLSGVILAYQDEKQIEGLRESYKGQYIIRRAGEQVTCVPIAEAIEHPIQGASYEATTSKDWSIFKIIIEEGVRKSFQLRYSAQKDVHISSAGRGIVITATGDRNDLVKIALASDKYAQEKLGFIQIYRKYYLEVDQSFDKDLNDRQFGLLIKIRTRLIIGASIADLMKRGVELKGCYALPLNTWQELGRGDRIVGRISEIHGDSVKLVDYRTDEFIPASQYTIEATMENLQKSITHILGQRSKAYGSLRAEIAKLLNPEGQLQRIKDIAGVISSSPVNCTPYLSVTIDKQALQTSSTSRISSTLFTPPGFLLKFGGQSIHEPIASAIALNGPFDRDSFQKTTPYILVITPKQYLGRVDQFLGSWRNGRINKYQKGFVSQYRLRGCDFHFVDFVETGNPSEDYKEACNNAIRHMHEKARRFDMAFVVIRETHRLLGRDDPYLITKAALMSREIPVQEIEIETIELPENNLTFVLNNLALASYAKMGGTPWVLASPKGKGIMHELVLGISSSVVGDSRIQGRERYVGITTVFNYDGFYQLSTVTQETSFDGYPIELRKSLLKSLQQVSMQKGWKNGDRVRIIIHATNPLRNLEMDVVKRLVEESLPEYKVDFAFLEISQWHDWMVYDPDSPGYKSYSGTVRGKQVPKRGSFVLLSDFDALLSVTGPAELKFAAQGCPEPLHLKLHRASTFNDLVYLSRQAFEFAHMSWKTYNALALPVTIEYSNAIARLLGRLRNVKNWNSDILQTSDLSKELWFL